MPWIAHESESLEKIRTSIVMVSDSLFSGASDFSEDKSSNVALESLNDNGIHSINLDYYPDDFAALRSKIEDDTSNGFDLIIFLGGTGITSSDVTVEALQSKLDKELLGFGEEFRRLGLVDVQERVILSRCTAGTYKRSLVVALPGSPNAVKTGIELTCKIVGHALNLLYRD